jgi:hypothetical protein
MVAFAGLSIAGGTAKLLVIGPFCFMAQSVCGWE